jgi:hypothetical protein
VLFGGCFGQMMQLVWLCCLHSALQRLRSTHDCFEASNVVCLVSNDTQLHGGCVALMTHFNQHHYMVAVVEVVTCTVGLKLTNWQVTLPIIIYTLSKNLPELTFGS